MATTAQDKPTNVAVVGAGVIGLQTAVSLQEAGHSVTLVADQFPDDEHDASGLAGRYTSLWAGAHWRTHAKLEDKEQQDWDMETYRKWTEKVEEENTNSNLDLEKRTGLSIFTSLNYWDTPTPPELWYETQVDGFRPIPAEELPTPAKSGVAFKAFAINVPIYLHYLYTRFTSLGGITVRATVQPDTKASQNPTVAVTSAVINVLTSSTPSASTSPDILILCPGLSASTLLDDSHMYPVRGQTLVLRGLASSIKTLLGTDSTGSYISHAIPRPSLDNDPSNAVTVVGGTKDEGNWSTETDDEVTKKILERARGLVPELLNEEGEFEVLGVQVGLRPARKGGARVEKEVVELGGEEGRKVGVVYCYGHEGAGYQNSVGCAKKVVALVAECLGEIGPGSASRLAKL